jgi:hypothetical protein
MLRFATLDETRPDNFRWVTPARADAGAVSMPPETTCWGMDAHQSSVDAETVRQQQYTNVVTAGGVLVRAFVAYADAEARGARVDICADLPGYEQPDDRLPAAHALRLAAREYARRARLRGDTAARMIVDLKALLSPAVPITRRVTLRGDLVSRVVSWCIESFYTDAD